MSKLLYCCYSIPQRDYLKSNGLRWEISGKSFNTNCPFWVYKNTDELSKLLKEWSSDK